MELSPEERRRIYEEEKARIEAAQVKEKAPSGSDTGLDSNVAGLLCYLGIWITGIVFLVIERKDNFVRFHALQSIIVFGSLSIFSAILSQIPFIGGILGAVLGIGMFILWVVLMIKAYQGEQYMIPVAGDIAAKSCPPGEPQSDVKKDVNEETKEPEKEDTEVAAETTNGQEKVEVTEKKKRPAYKYTRAGRIAASSAAIVWSLIALVFFSFFSNYIAFYEKHQSGGSTYWTRTPMLTDAYYEWLPVQVTTLLLTIAGHVILLKYDRYWLRETIHIILNILSIVVVVSLLVIFPFNFSAAPAATNLATTLSILTTIVLIALAVILSIATIVMFIKLIVYLASGNTEPSRL